VFKLERYFCDCFARISTLFILFNKILKF